MHRILIIITHQDKYIFCGAATKPWKMLQEIPNLTFQIQTCEEVACDPVFNPKTIHIHWKKVKKWAPPLQHNVILKSVLAQSAVTESFRNPSYVKRRFFLLCSSCSSLETHCEDAERLFVQISSHNKQHMGAVHMRSYVCAICSRNSQSGLLRRHGTLPRENRAHVFIWSWSSLQLRNMTLNYWAISVNLNIVPWFWSM